MTFGARVLPAPLRLFVAPITVRSIALTAGSADKPNKVRPESGLDTATPAIDIVFKALQPVGRLNRRRARACIPLRSDSRRRRTA